jgi:hypothetical protein
MKNLKKFENFNQVNEGLGLALLGGFVGMLAAPGAYKWAKNFWSKNVVGAKYKETGKTEKLITKLPSQVSTVVVLSVQQREAGEVVTELKEYEDNLGNKFWGWDHLWNDGAQNWESNPDLYTALYKADDLEDLKKFLVNPERFTGKGGLYKPNPIEMIYRKDGPTYKEGNN